MGGHLLVVHTVKNQLRKLAEKQRMRAPVHQYIYRVDQKKVALVQKKVANFILHLETSGFFYWLNLVLWILNL